MILSLASCSSGKINTDAETDAEISNTETENNTADTVHNADGVFAAGFAKESITPQVSVPMAGYGNDINRYSGKILDKVYATCIALKDADGNIALIYTLDLLSTPDSFISTALSTVSKAVGVPQENMIFSATHTHEGPSPNTTDAISIAWRTLFYKAVKKAAADAIADLDKAEIYAGKIKCENFNFLRRYLTSDGKGLGDNYGSGTPIAHEAEADNNLQIIKFARENQKDIVIVNWQAHPSINGGSAKTDISADYPYYLRHNIEKSEDVLCAFYEGAAGNLNISGRLKDEKPYTEANKYGKALAKKVIEALPNLEKLESGSIRSEISTMNLTVDHTKDSLLPQAQQVHDLFSANDMEAAKRKAQSFGFDSVYTANHIISKSNQGASKDVKIWAISCGDIAFIGAPYEMFCENGLAIKENSPFKLTFVCEQANGGNSYIPSAGACKNGGYEVTACTFIPGTAEILQNEFVAMLQRLK